MTLINECLEWNVFGGREPQKRGLAMGQKLVPVLAIYSMSGIADTVLARMP